MVIEAGDPLDLGVKKAIKLSPLRFYVTPVNNLSLMKLLINYHLHRVLTTGDIAS